MANVLLFSDAGEHPGTRNHNLACLVDAMSVHPRRKSPLFHLQNQFNSFDNYLTSFSIIDMTTYLKIFYTDLP